MKYKNLIKKLYKNNKEYKTYNITNNISIYNKNTTVIFNTDKLSYQDREDIKLYLIFDSEYTSNDRCFNDLINIKTNNIHITKKQNKILKNMLNFTSYDFTKPNVNGFMFDTKKQCIVTDLTRLVKLSNLRSNLINEITIPNNIIEFMTAFNNDFTIEYRKKDTFYNIKVFNEFVTIYSNSIKELFPDYKEVIPEKYNLTVGYNRKNLLTILKQLKTIAKENRYIVGLIIDKNNTDLTCIIPDKEFIKTVSINSFHLTPDFDKVFKIIFNINYLIDVLSMYDTENIEFSMLGPLQPVCIDTPELFTIVMPVRSE